jgi:predicted DNA-binding protein YlxM (UPF0122 family)
MLTKDLILTSISSSVKVSTSLVNYFINSTDNNVEKFKNELLVIDLYNSLNVILTVIEDIIKKHGSSGSIKALPPISSTLTSEKQTLITGPLITGPLTTGPLTTCPLTTGPLTTGPLTTGPLTSDKQTLITGPLTLEQGSCLVIANNRNNKDYSVNRLQESCIVINDNIPIPKKSIILPEPVKKALFSTYEIIEKIKIILQQVYKKIDLHKTKYFSSWRGLDLTADIKEIKLNNSIFEKRVAMLFDIIKIYLGKT